MGVHLKNSYSPEWDWSGELAGTGQEVLYCFERETLVKRKTLNKVKLITDYF